MRPRLVVLATVVTTLLAFAVSNAAAAAPSQNIGLTINVTPNPIFAGQGVLVYGQLNTVPVAAQRVILYHRLAGSRRGYIEVAKAQTDSHGFYEFTRAENVVETNRSWLVQAPAAHALRSRTAFEQVAALVTASVSTMSAATGQPVTFTGSVAPNHGGELVQLQQQIGSSSDWQTIDATRLRPDSRYTFTHRFRLAGERNIRVLFPGDVQNVPGASDAIALTIQQKQIPDFTISSSLPMIDYGQPVTISGVLYQPGSSTRPELGTPVTLWARSALQRQFSPVFDAATSNQNGSYSFTPPAPTSNTVYQVRTTVGGERHSALLFEAVRDVVSLTPSPTTTPLTVGSKVTLMGTVMPDKTGLTIYLQRLGPDGAYHNVASTLIQFGSTFTFDWTFGKAGPYQFRARIDNSRGNIGGASAPVTFQVAPPTSPEALPPAS